MMLAYEFLQEDISCILRNDLAGGSRQGGLRQLCPFVNPGFFCLESFYVGDMIALSY